MDKENVVHLHTGVLLRETLVIFICPGLPVKRKTAYSKGLWAPAGQRSHSGFVTYGMGFGADCSTSLHLFPEYPQYLLMTLLGKATPYCVLCDYANGTCLSPLIGFYPTSPSVSLNMTSLHTNWK